MSSKYNYEVALSFAGENRSYVQSVAQILQSKDISVFYDDFERVNLWGKDLVDFLDEVYRLRAEYCVLFVSSAYRQKAWTNHERKSALSRALNERGEYILPARFDDTKLPGLTPNIAYIDLRDMTPKEFAELILQKIGKTSKEAPSKKLPAFRIPRVQTESFNPFNAALVFMNQVRNEIEGRCNSISHLGVSVSTFGPDREQSIRVVAQGKTLYSFDMKLDETFGDATIMFHGTRNIPVSRGNSFNAWGKLEKDSIYQSIVLRLNDISLLKSSGSETVLSPKEFIDALWIKICDEIERVCGGDHK